MAEEQTSPLPETANDLETQEEQRPTSRGVLLGLAKFAVAGVILYWLYRKGAI